MNETLYFGLCFRVMASHHEMPPAIIENQSGLTKKLNMEKVGYAKKSCSVA